MSRGFVKESDQEPTPMVPPRAALPADATNYVTPRGLELLNAESKQLHEKVVELSAAPVEEARLDLGVARAQLVELESRLASAKLVEPDEVDDETVRFGATVSYRVGEKGKPVEVTIVGVDEANLKERRVSYLSPIAQALTGKTVGDTAELEMQHEMRTLHILEISYS